MNTRPIRVPNVQNAEHQVAREQRAFLRDFDRQVAELEERRAATAIAPSSDTPTGSADR